MSDDVQTGGDRRPLTSRNTRWARYIAARLAQGGVSPNLISAFSVVFAAGCFGCFLLAAGTGGRLQSATLIAAAACIQLRLLCNLLDGMVAIEGGLQSATGAIWNELPDRIGDILILVGAGLFADSATLGWAASALAILTAYSRELGTHIDGVVDFRGPMAKPHRMALLTFASLLSIAELILIEQHGTVMQIALWVVIVGSAVTTLRRTRALSLRLKADPARQLKDS